MSKRRLIAVVIVMALAVTTATAGWIGDVIGAAQGIAAGLICKYQPDNCGDGIIVIFDLEPAPPDDGGGTPDPPPAEEPEFVDSPDPTGG